MRYNMKFLTIYDEDFTVKWSSDLLLLCIMIFDILQTYISIDWSVSDGKSDQTN